MIDLYLSAVCLGFLVWLPIRILFWWRLRLRDHRKYGLLLIWPLLNFIHFFGLKSWLGHPMLYQITGYILLFGLAADSFYYLLIKSESKTRMPVWAALGLVPFALAYWLLHRPGGESLVLSLPHYGKALVWHDPMFQARSYYFMKPGTGPKPGDSYNDPNFGQAIFSPCGGEVAGFDTSTSLLTLKPKTAPDTRLSLGPFLPESLRLHAGDTVSANQPLGLQGGSGPIPGIQVTIEGTRDFTFEQFLAGRWWARQIRHGRPVRNQTVISQHQNRFRLRPAKGGD